MRIRAIHAMTGSTPELLERERQLFKKYGSPDTVVDIVCITEGAASIESRFDEYIGAVNTLKLVKEAEELGYDAVIITCWGNACLEPAREIVKIPVVSSGLASMVIAAGIAHRFSIIGTIKNAAHRHLIEVRKLGLENLFASERFIDTFVLELSSDRRKTINAIIEAGRKAIDEDGAQCLILGCFGFAGFAEEIAAVLQVPVIDPAAAVINYTESLVRMGISQSKIAYPTPPDKPRSFCFGSSCG
ncbi:MAG: hypothetical protein GX058_09670 [Firmicutes bacterium]|nr:hypothetical protein [Bacillota bacterium]